MLVFGIPLLRYDNIVESAVHFCISYFSPALTTSNFVRGGMVGDIVKCPSKSYESAQA